jgi:pimeloyl-ACP methyl ester carboxylesterase
LARAFEAEFDVVMPDARGHGNSSTPLNGYRYEDHARDVVGLIQGLGLAAPVLLGHSMGGMTAGWLGQCAFLELGSELRWFPFPSLFLPSRR